MSLSVGDRVLANKKPGTIRFIGPTGFAAGEWFGVELDTADGKNDGMGQDDVRYFTCTDGHGTFCRKIQVKPLADVSAPSAASAAASAAATRRSSLGGSSSSSARRTSLTGAAASSMSSRRSSGVGVKAPASSLAAAASRRAAPELAAPPEAAPLASDDGGAEESVLVDETCAAPPSPNDSHADASMRSETSVSVSQRASPGSAAAPSTAKKPAPWMTKKAGSPGQSPRPTASSTHSPAPSAEASVPLPAAPSPSHAAELLRLGKALAAAEHKLSATENKLEKEIAARHSAQHALQAAEAAAAVATKAASASKATAEAAMADAKAALEAAKLADVQGGDRERHSNEVKLAEAEAATRALEREVSVLTMERDEALAAGEELAEAKAAAEGQAAALKAEATRIAAELKAANASLASGGGAGPTGAAAVETAAEVKAAVARATAGLKAEAVKLTAALEREQGRVGEGAKRLAKAETRLAEAEAAKEQALLEKEEVEVRVEELELELETLQADLDRSAGNVGGDGLGLNVGTDGDDGEEGPAAALAALRAERDQLADVLRQLHRSAAAEKAGLQADLDEATEALALAESAAESVPDLEAALAAAEARACEAEGRLEDFDGDAGAELERLTEELVEAHDRVAKLEGETAACREALSHADEHRGTRGGRVRAQTFCKLASAALAGTTLVPSWPRFSVLTVCCLWLYRLAPELLEETEELLREEVKDASAKAAQDEARAAELERAVAAARAECAELRRDLDRAAVNVAEVRRRRDEALTALNRSQTTQAALQSQTKGRAKGGPGPDPARGGDLSTSLALVEARSRLTRLEGLVSAEVLSAVEAAVGQDAAEQAAHEQRELGDGAAVVSSVSESLAVEAEVALARGLTKVLDVQERLLGLAGGALRNALRANEDRDALAALRDQAAQARAAASALSARRKASKCPSASGASASGASSLDPAKLKALKVAQLREELGARGLSTSGLKADLVGRLAEAVEAEERAAAAAAETSDDEFEDASGDVQPDSGVGGLEVASEEAVAAATAAASEAASDAAAAATRCAAWVGTGSDSGPLGAVLPVVLRGGLALRTLLHVAAAPGGHSGGPSAAAAAAIEALGEVRRFETTIDALSRPLGDDPAVTPAGTVGAPLPERLVAACSVDRLLGAVAALEKAATRAWVTSRPHGEAVTEADEGWRSDLLSLNLLRSHAAHATLRVASTANSGEGTAALRAALALCGDLERFQRVCEGRTGDEDADLPAALATLNTEGSSRGAPSGWTLEAMPDALGKQVAGLAKGLAALALDLDALDEQRKKNAKGLAGGSDGALATGRLVAALATLREMGEVDSGATVVPCSRILDSAANWRAVVAFGTLAPSEPAAPRPVAPAAVRAASFRSFLGASASCLPELKAANKALESLKGAKVAQER